jgi:hypothetical protein
MNEMTVSNYATDRELVPRLTSQFWIEAIFLASVMRRILPAITGIPMVLVQHVRFVPLSSGLQGVLSDSIVNL